MTTIIEIPSIWGNAELVDWSIRGVSTTAEIGPERYKTVEDAIKSYPKVFNEYIDDIRKNAKYGEDAIKYQLFNLPIIVPVYKYEGALLNPYVIGWDFAILPLIFIKTIDECRSFNGRFYENTCIRNFNEEDQLKWNDDEFLSIKEKILEMAL